MNIFHVNNFQKFFIAKIIKYTIFMTCDLLIRILILPSYDKYKNVTRLSPMIHK